MKFITQLSRILVGALFIFSGLIKLNDPVGFSFKLHDYFAEDVLDIAFMLPFVLPLAVFIVILEVILGLSLLLGFWKRITSWLLLLMILFFTFLTFYSAYFDKVTDCGCFGDAIPLVPWESFGKDVILSILIFIIFFNLKYIKPLFSNKVSSLSLLIAVVACSFLANHVLNHLPLKDFRVYAEGKNIIEGMKEAEELGLEAPEYITLYTMVNSSTGEEQKVSSIDYNAEKWWEKKDWEIKKGESKSVLIKEGYTPPIHDFVILFEGRDETQNVLNAEEVFLLISYDINKADKQAFDKINAFAAEAEKLKKPFIGLSASLDEDVDAFRHDVQAAFPFATMDATTLKTIIRANPGIVLLKKGSIIKKWHYNDLPSFEEVMNKHLN